MISSLKTLYGIVIKPIKGDTHAQRLDSFYGGQADGYDDFRTCLLPGRSELITECARKVPPSASWIDIGCGTASNLEIDQAFTAACSSITLVDLCEPLLVKARARVRRLGFNQVEVHRGDATSLPLPPADLVTFSFSLTMIPNWFQAIDNAVSALKPGGILGVVDFYTSRKFPERFSVTHGFLTRTMWPIWFGFDNVHLSGDHIPYLTSKIEPLSLFEARAALPYIPFARVPYYRFVGIRAADDGPLRG